MHINLTFCYVLSHLTSFQVVAMDPTLIHEPSSTAMDPSCIAGAGPNSSLDTIKSQKAQAQLARMPSVLWVDRK